MKAILSLLAVISVYANGVTAQENEPVHLMYEERAPYLIRAGNTVEGLTGRPAGAAFKMANVPFVWEMASMSRQLRLLRENFGARCVVGWFKNTERLGIFKYTKPIYRDGPTVALVRRQFVFGSGANLIDTLSATALRVIVRGKYSYGPYVDSALKRIRPVKVESNLPNVQLTELLKADRADLMLASEEEATFLLQRSDENARALRLLHFADVGPGENRHIVCSRSVSDEIIARLNRSIGAK